MDEAKTCPKCNGAMTQGRILRTNEYVARNQYMYVFAPDEAAQLDLSRAIAGGAAAQKRRGLVAFCCESCGFTELYGLP